ncbi:unnamed protein product [Symbiodinium microadriaticum]|nr:unnamed protein product [Symbiodinium microadriaticum]
MDRTGPLCAAVLGLGSFLHVMCRTAAGSGQTFETPRQEPQAPEHCSLHVLPGNAQEPDSTGSLQGEAAPEQHPAGGPPELPEATEEAKVAAAAGPAPVAQDEADASAESPGDSPSVARVRRQRLNRKASEEELSAAAAEATQSAAETTVPPAPADEATAQAVASASKRTTGDHALNASVVAEWQLFMRHFFDDELPMHHCPQQFFSGAMEHESSKGAETLALGFEPGIHVPLPNSRSTAKNFRSPPAMAKSRATKDKAQRLREMGFASADVDEALRCCRTMCRAVEWLTEASAQAQRQAKGNNSSQAAVVTPPRDVSAMASPAQDEVEVAPRAPAFPRHSLGPARLASPLSPRLSLGRLASPVSPRLSLSSLLSVPADLWSADQCQAAAKELLCAGKRKRSTEIQRPSFVEPMPAPEAVAVEGTRPRRRLRGKQPPSGERTAPCVQPTAEAPKAKPKAPVGQSVKGRAAEKFSDKQQKWAIQLRDMGFTKRRVDATLPGCRSLREVPREVGLQGQDRSREVVRIMLKDPRQRQRTPRIRWNASGLNDVMRTLQLQTIR